MYVWGESCCVALAHTLTILVHLDIVNILACIRRCIYASFSGFCCIFCCL